MPGSVRVPVLSTQTTSTRASPSMAASSWTSTRRRASRTAARVKAAVVRSTSPSGTMAPTPATEPRSASSSDWLARVIWLTMRRIPTGTMTQVTRRRMRLIPCCSSERTRLKRRASPCSRWAKASPPTWVTRMTAFPATMALPDRIRSPGCFSTARDSPVRSDSSTSSPPSTSILPSATTWSPGRSSSMSSTTTASTGNSTVRPSRTAWALGAVSTARRSRVRLDRTSWTTPNVVFTTTTRAKTPSLRGPTIRITTKSVPRMALNRVATLALRIWATLRPLVTATWLDRPSAIRAATWSALRPTSGETASSPPASSSAFRDDISGCRSSDSGPHGVERHRGQRHRDTVEEEGSGDSESPDHHER